MRRLDEIKEVFVPNVRLDNTPATGKSLGEGCRLQSGSIAEAHRGKELMAAGHVRSKAQINSPVPSGTVAAGATVNHVKMESPTAQLADHPTTRPIREIYLGTFWEIKTGLKHRQRP